jgi:O-antigen/teichoic acid export membrane protein
MTRPIVLVGVARAVSLILGMLLLGILGRRLGPAGFGVLQFALAVMVYPALLVDLGLTTYGLREIAKGSPSSSVIRTILGARLVLGLCVVIVVVAGVLLLPLDAESRLIFLILTLGVPGSALNARWVLQGEQRFGRSAIVELMTTATQLLAAFALVHGAPDVRWAATALTLATWVTAAASMLLAGQWRRFRPRIGRGIPALILRSLPLGAAAIAIAIYYSIDTVLLGIFRSAEEVAYYAAAYRIILPILAMAAAVGSVAVPHLSFLDSTNNAAADQAAATLSRQLFFWALPLSVGGALIAETIIQTVYGTEFGPAAAPFRILVWSVLTVYGNAAFAFLMLARQRDRRYLIATTAGALMNVGLNLFVIPLAGMIGAALTTMVSELTVLGLILWWTRDVSPSAIPAAIRIAAVPTLAMSLVVWPVHDSILAVPVGVVVYVLVAVLTGAIPASPLVDRAKRLRT